MRTAQDFRNAGLNNLRGHWKKALLASFVTTIFGVGVVSSSARFWTEDIESVIAFVKGFDSFWSYSKALTLFLIGIIAFDVISLFVGGAIRLGYAQFNINLADRKPVTLRDVFSKMNRLASGLWLNVQMALFTFLWSLLFVIPGVIKALSYSMAPYILAEDPEKTPSEAITESQTMMDGQKWRLFCLSFSFIGWILVCVIPMYVLQKVGEIVALVTGSVIGYFVCMAIGAVATYVGFIFLKVYQEATFAEFYRNLTKYKLFSEVEDNAAENPLMSEVSKADFRWPE